MSQGKQYTEAQREEIIQSIRPYLEMGFSRNRACSLIGLTPSNLCNWTDKNEALEIRLQSYENAVNKLVMANLVDAIRIEGENDSDSKKETTRWWAERKMKNDFSTRTETDINIKELPKPIMDFREIETIEENALLEDYSNKKDSETI